MTSASRGEIENNASNSPAPGRRAAPLRGRGRAIREVALGGAPVETLQRNLIHRVAPRSENRPHLVHRPRLRKRPLTPTIAIGSGRALRASATSGVTRGVSIAATVDGAGSVFPPTAAPRRCSLGRNAAQAGRRWGVQRTRSASARNPNRADSRRANSMNFPESKPNSMSERSAESCSTGSSSNSEIARFNSSATIGSDSGLILCSAERCRHHRRRRSHNRRSHQQQGPRANGYPGQLHTPRMHRPVLRGPIRSFRREPGIQARRSPPRFRRRSVRAAKRRGREQRRDLRLQIPSHRPRGSPRARRAHRAPPAKV